MTSDERALRIIKKKLRAGVRLAKAAREIKKMYWANEGNKGHEYISCYTFGTKIPPQWHNFRRALKEWDRWQK